MSAVNAPRRGRSVSQPQQARQLPTTTDLRAHLDRVLRDQYRIERVVVKVLEKLERQTAGR